MEEIFSRTSSFRFPNHLIPRSHPSTSVNARAFQAYFLLFFLFFFISVVSPPLSSHFLDRLEFHHLFSPSSSPSCSIPRVVSIIASRKQSERLPAKRKRRSPACGFAYRLPMVFHPIVGFFANLRGRWLHRLDPLPVSPARHTRKHCVTFSTARRGDECLEDSAGPPLYGIILLYFKCGFITI